MAYICGMPRSQKISNPNRDAFLVTTPSLRMRKAAFDRDQVIIDRANAAKGRAIGIDVTEVSDDDLLADLRRRRVSA